MVAAERRDLAARLEPLTPEQWRTPSLCDAWAVQHVVGHLLVGPTMGVTDFATAMVRGRGSFHRANTILARKAGDRPADELVATLRSIAGSRFTPPGHGVLAPLTDTLVHREDIARPLGGWDRDPAPWLPALDFLVSKAARRGFVSARRPAVRWVATDLDWSSGEGPRVEGPAAGIALAMLGRTAASHVSGDGVAVLARE